MRRVILPADTARLRVEGREPPLRLVHRIKHIGHRVLGAEPQSTRRRHLEVSLDLDVLAPVHSGHFVTPNYWQITCEIELPRTSISSSPDLRKRLRFERGFGPATRAILDFAIKEGVDALSNSLTVGDNVAYALRERGELDEVQISRVVDSLLDKVGISAERDRFPADLSTGMKRSVAIALAENPEAVLYDEPTTMVDPLMAHR
jgi:ABC transporter